MTFTTLHTYEYINQVKCIDVHRHSFEVVAMVGALISHSVMLTAIVRQCVIKLKAVTVVHNQQRQVDFNDSKEDNPVMQVLEIIFINGYVPI